MGGANDVINKVKINYDALTLTIKINFQLNKFVIKVRILFIIQFTWFRYAW